MRLIDADVLIEEFKKWLPKEDSEWLQSGIHPLENLSVSAILTIEEQPTVEAKEVVHGEWIAQDEGLTKFMCSACKGKFHGGYEKFCPDCGADMRKKV